MKICYKCEQVKILSKFHKDCTTVDGYSNKCKICRLKYNKEYRQTEKGIIAHRKSSNRYQKTEKGKATERRYSVKYPERRKAKQAVCSAIRAGKLIRPDIFICCVSHCLNQAEQYHHLSYEEEHRLNVLPICKKCHKRIHWETI